MTSLPVIITGRMGYPDRIREVLSEDLADMIGLEVAEMLLAQGRNVVACLRFDTVILCSDMEPETPSNIDHAFGPGVAVGNRL